MKFTKSFVELGAIDIDIAGGKGASLGEMIQAGIPVPLGFVILSSTFDEFINDNNLIQEIDAIFDKVNHKNINSVEVASEEIRALIKNAVMSKNISQEISKQFKELNTEYVAVRSSATAEDGVENAWAGQLDSYLNVKEGNLLEKVQDCWASLFTPRAIFYSFEKGFHTTKISVAVIIQKMVNSEISGIAFSVHPVTEDRNQMIIEAGFGLGEAIVSGQITPNSYVVKKNPRNIIDIKISTQDRALYRSDKASAEHGNNEWVNLPEPKASSQVLTEAQILELSEIILKIENHYGFPCDIEWAYEQNKFYITQSRPITTLNEKQVLPYREKILQQNFPFTSKNWKKNWDGGWSLLTCSYLGYQYTKQLFEVLGVSVKESLFVSHNGTSACYFIDEHKKSFGNFIANKAIENPEIILEWAQKLKSATDYVLDLIKNLKIKEASLSNFELFIAGMYESGVYHRLIKVVVD